MAFLSPVAPSNESVSAFDEYAANPRFQELQTELRSLLFEGVQGDAQGGAQSLEQQHQQQSRQQEGSHQRLLSILLSSKCNVPLSSNIHYLKTWIAECAPWLDMFDQDRHFGLQVPILAQSHPSILFALLALSARQNERQRGITGSHDSLELYQQAISSLTPTLNSEDSGVLVTACILCVLEMMSVSPRDWRSHLEGCAALFRASGINGFSGGLLQAVFWCYARMDVCYAFIADGAESTVLPVENWISLENTDLMQSSNSSSAHTIGESFISKGIKTPDMHANYAVYLCAKVISLLCRRTRCIELNEDNGCRGPDFTKEWQELWEELNRWYSNRPAEMLPAKETSRAAATHHFPTIFFAHWAAISSNQLYHTACISMLEMNAEESVSFGEEAAVSPLWHARRIVGISLTNPHKGCLNNAIQPLYVAGKLFTHREEHGIIVQLLNQIEGRTGWGSRWRIKDLEFIWGYPRGTLT